MSDSVINLVFQWLLKLAEGVGGEILCHFELKMWMPELNQQFVIFEGKFGQGFACLI